MRWCVCVWLVMWLYVILSMDHAPTNPRPHLNLGAAYLEHGRLDEASTEFLDALSINPTLWAAKIDLGAVQISQGKYYDAENTLLDTPSDLASPHFLLAVLYLRQERYKEALAQSTIGLDIEPAQYQAWMNRGLILDRLGRHEESIEATRIGIRYRDNTP